KDFALFEEEQVAGFGADVQEHGAIFQLAVVVTKGVAEGGGGNVGELQVEPGGLGDPEEAFDDIGLDGDEQDLQFAAGGRAQNLVIPDDLFEREGDVLLGLVLDDLGDFARVHRGKLDEFGEDVEAGGADVDVFAFDALFGQHVLEGFEDGGFAGGLLGPFGAQ